MSCHNCAVVRGDGSEGSTDEMEVDLVFGVFASFWGKVVDGVFDRDEGGSRVWELCVAELIRCLARFDVSLELCGWGCCWW